MKFHVSFTSSILLAMLSAACDESTLHELLVHDEESLPAVPPAPDHLLARRQLAATGHHLFTRSAEISLTDANDLAAALDVPADLINMAELEAPDADAAQELLNLGVIRPRRGPSFVALSTGRIRVDPPPEPGTDFGAEGAGDDVVLLRIGINVPRGANRLSFDFNFLSAESPDFVGSEFNDTFTVRVIDAFETGEVASASVNSSFFFDVSHSRADGTGFALFADDPAGVDYNFGPGAYPPGIQIFPDAGITDFKPVNVAVASGGNVIVEFEIRDVADGILDSTVIIDNVSFSAIEVVDPNPELIDEFDGTVVTDPAALAMGGSPVRAVATDGLTPVLLRMGVPGPGQVTYSIVGGSDVAGNGGFSTVGASGREASVVVDVQQASAGRYYAFAIYRGPENFHRGAAHPGDGALAGRNVRIHAEYTPGIGTGFEHEHEIELVRPPVVIVHDIWSSCLNWAESSILTDIRFRVACADYTSNNAGTLASNSSVVLAGYFDVINKMRRIGIAATQADFIGHGTGGLLTRKHVDASNYERFTNFYEGDLNRIITLNTPHLGTRMADEIVVFREHLQADPDPSKWSTVRNSLLPLIIDDNTAIDELRSNSPIINEISATPVPSHMIFSGGGLDVPRLDAQALTPDDIQLLYTRMEFLHPLTRLLPIMEKQKLIYGAESKIFCADEHDLLVTEWDQNSGLIGAATSRFPVAADNTNSAHFLVMSDTAHINHLASLLDARVEGASYAPSLPSPGSVPRLNSCLGGSSIPLIRDENQLAGEPVRAVAEGTLRIVTPYTGTPVSPGSTISVVVQSEGGFHPTVMFISGMGEGVIVEQAPFVVSFPIPEKAIGEVNLIAFGIDDLGNVALSEPVALPVQVSAALASMRVLNGDADLQGPGSIRKLIVLGDYNDGVTRDISSPGVGSIYSSSNDAIVTVSSDGTVTAVGSGIATVAVRNGGVATSITVTVGDGSFCRGSLYEACTPNCPCSPGVGDCDEDEDCMAGGRCLHDGGASFGYDDPEVDICVIGCPAEGTGSWNFCTPECPCGHGAGDCDEDEDCVAGGRCLHDGGASFGYDDLEMDVCVVGCPELGGGARNFCTPECPCAAGEGDCDSRADCELGLKCARDVGLNYGFDPDVDVCEAPAL